MVDSNYFIRGYAIHGYAEVPVYAASHGCLRIPIPDAAEVYAWVQVGYWVDVYTEGGVSRTMDAAHTCVLARLCAEHTALAASLVCWSMRLGACLEPPGSRRARKLRAKP